jgi:hypothetical protein
MVFRDIVFIDTSVFFTEYYLALWNRIHTIGKLGKEGKGK